MKEYLDIVKKVLNNGQWKSPVRKNHQTGKWEPVDGGVRTLACANVLFSHDMNNGFPLLTTKKMAFKTLCVELEGFIKGITDKQWYKDRKCNIWNSWANPQKVEETLSNFNKFHDSPKYAAEAENDLGPIYGYQWRKFDEHYPVTWDDYGDVDGKCEWANRIHDDWEVNGVQHGTDQLKNIVDTLQNNPMDRRMVCSAWNPNQMHMMALPPCHYSWNVTVIGDELNLFWAQRSCDLMLGVPFNIASYGLLLCLLAEVGGFKRGNLSGMLVDCHIYENQIPAAKEQITREPRPLPDVQVIMPVDFTEDGPRNDIFGWTYDMVSLTNYNPHEKLDFGKVVV